MNFSRIARQLNEGESLDAAAKASENAAAGAEKQTSGTARSREKQKAQMATQQSVVKKSDVSYASEQARIEREMISSYSKQASDWRTELVEAAGPDEEGNHPYVDVMPFMNQKQNEAKRQMKDSAKIVFQLGHIAIHYNQQKKIKPNKNFNYAIEPEKVNG